MALATHLTLEVVTPDRAVVRESVDEIQIQKATLGFFQGILPYSRVFKWESCGFARAPTRLTSRLHMGSQKFFQIV